MRGRWTSRAKGCAAAATRPLPHRLWQRVPLRRGLPQPRTQHGALVLAGLRGVAWSDLHLQVRHLQVPASNMECPGAHALLPDGRQGLPWAAQGARLPQDRWPARQRTRTLTLSPAKQPARHLQLADHACLPHCTEIEFVDGGAVFPGAPRPPGNNYSVNGVPYKVGAINAVGRGSNKARTDAISKWLGVVPGEAANASAKLLPSGPSGPIYEVAGINAIGQGSNAARTDAIDRFLDKAMLRGDEGWSDQPFSKEHRTKKRGDAH